MSFSHYRFAMVAFFAFVVKSSDFHNVHYWPLCYLRVMPTF